MSARRNAVLAAVLSMLAGCSVPTTKVVDRRPGFALRGSEPQRIAVLPLRDAVPSPSLLYYLGRPFVWAARVVTLDFGPSMPSSATAAQTMRMLLAARLHGESTEIVDLGQLDCALANCSHARDDAGIVALAKELDVDAVLEGELRGLGAGWAVVRTNRELAGRVRLRSGRDGSVLFTADVAIGNGVGIDHGPTGWVSLVATPLAALDSGPYTAMSIDWAEVVGRELIGRSVLAVDGREPMLKNVQVEAHDGPLGPGARLVVTADGPPDASVHFHLGTLHREIPMFAIGKQPDGLVRYRGVYRLRAGDRARQAPIAVHLLLPGGGEVVHTPERRFDLGGF